MNRVTRLVTAARVTWGVYRVNGTQVLILGWPFAFEMILMYGEHCC